MCMRGLKLIRIESWIEEYFSIWHNELQIYYYTITINLYLTESVWNTSELVFKNAHEGRFHLMLGCDWSNRKLYVSIRFEIVLFGLDILFDEGLVDLWFGF